MRVVILDTETNGLSNDDKAIEVAAVLYDCVHAEPMSTFATLIHATHNGAEHINGIKPELLLDSTEGSVAWDRVGELMTACDAVIAHNAPFDRRFTPKKVAEMKPWICSQRDIAWPVACDNQKLTTIAIAHGIPVISAHRALTDVDLLVRLFQRLSERGHDVAEMLREAMRKKPLVQALVSFDDKELAKRAGFYWEPEPLKRWVRRMPIEDTKKLPFKTKVLEA